MSNIQISIQAFFQEIQNWSLSLSRQSKKLKSLKQKVYNKFKLNSIQIILTEIQSSQIKYKKIKNKYQHLLSNQNKKLNLSINNQNVSDQILNEYSHQSRVFMQILQKISILDEEQDSQNKLLTNDFNNNSQKQKDQTKKTFLNQTFAYKASKQQKNKVNKSLFEKRKGSQIKQSQRPYYRNKTNSIIGISNQNLYDNQKKQNDSLYLNMNKKNDKKSNKNMNSILNYNQHNDDSQDLWQIRLQLTQIKAMMKQMQSQIKYHQHQQTNKQINKIQNTNRKITSQIKSIKQQNRYILSKIQTLRQQLMEQKKMQVEMINKYQRKNNQSGLSYHQSIHESRKTNAVSHLQSMMDKSANKTRTEELAENVSDWVKIRI